MHDKKSQWQEELSDQITEPQELFDLLALKDEDLIQSQLAAKLFGLKIPRRYLAFMEKGNINDPLLKQFMALGSELKLVPGYSHDPLQEGKVNPVPGLLHKYHGRVLITLTSACAVHCRYCFRRSFPYEKNNPGRKGLAQIFKAIAADETINEVILSGGDPLTVPDKTLQWVTDQLKNIRHIKRLRIHTRLPLIIPSRITDEFIQWLQSAHQQVIFVIHANHPNELTIEVKQALQTMKMASAALLNQSVLLKDVNADASILAALSESLFAAGVLPYYLHVLDKVAGAAHFDLPINEALNLHAKLTALLPGYLVPKLVCEQPGAPAKTVIT